ALSRSAQQGERFALVLLDAQMPDADGCTLARRIHQQPELTALPLILLSETGRQEDVARRRELGIAVCLTKPVEQSEVLDAILLALGRSAPAREQGPRVRRPAVSPGRCGLRVLLAEDVPVNQRLAITLLERAGHTVVVAGNGREALETLERQVFDLVLMD